MSDDLALIRAFDDLNNIERSCGLDPTPGPRCGCPPSWHLSGHITHFFDMAPVGRDDFNPEPIFRG